ncbi:nuclear autoantigenic sperm protein-like isoform X4 [Amphibalanus amphitrite]|uniref:nuclear autoantigenic sperm protein-like isoform X4 n=1 Tax=Amphibalanus amphitrite TaxID=1232801 RepID=UPI001C9186AE|nr:nuclear autoantigenic sperm protein-like isoform X4 [Amphibalanus amphitrite]
MADKESAPQCENEKEVKTDSAETKAVQVEGKEGSPKSSPSKIETNEALQHLVQGKRHLLVRDVNSAVNSLQEACRLLAEQYGETADPCGEAYFFYGKALLELSRIETGVLGNALDGVPEGDDADTSQTEDPEKLSESTEGDEEEDGDDEEAEDAPVKEDGEGETKEDAGEEAKDGDKGEEDGAEGEEGADTTKEGDTSRDCDTEEGEEGEGDGAKEGDDEEEDVPNIQLAWEVLELAKIIFTRQAKDKPSDLKLSEVYQKLGEVSIEAENYSQAVDDLGNCLTIQKKHLDADDRLIAETHYHLGVAHSLANQYSEAIAAFQASVDTILARVQRLQRQILDRENGKKIEHEDPFYKEENEIKELEDLIPDMKEKIADMRDMKAEAQKKIAEVFAASGGAGPSTSAAPISPVKAMMTSRPAASAADGDGEKKEAHSIGHLVKRKRLSEPAAEEDAKRTKQENGHNGVNGHAAP